MATEFSKISDTAVADRLPPQNIEAEQSVLGSLLLDKDSVIKVADLLNIGDFYRGIHNTIYGAILDLYQKGEPADLLSAANRLEEMKKLGDIGGTSYLAELINAVPTTANVLTYAKIVRRKKILRDLIGASYHIAQLGYNENEETDNLLDQAQQKIFGISQRSLQQNFFPVKSVLEEAFERLDRLHQEKGVFRGVPTGFTDLDNHLAGLQKSDLVVLAARPSLGKTTMALDIARHIAVKEKIPVGIFSLEMSKHDLIDRFLAAEAGVNLWKLRTGNLSSEGFNNDFLKIQEALGTLSEAPIFIEDSASHTVLQMRTMARRLQAEEKLGLLIIDYLQLIQPSNAADSEVRQLTEISRSLKGLARELEVPVLAISQFSRAPEARPDQMPRLSDLRGSGSIEQDADVVMFIYREDRVKKDSDRPNIADIIIAKHRNGPTGTVQLYFNEAHTSFKNLEKRSFE
jgi:replicative DNA helicase